MMPARPILPPYEEEEAADMGWLWLLAAYSIWCLWEKALL